MILFADSGSTKCSWALCDVQENIVFKCDTIGFNPYFINKDRIIEHLKESELNKYNKDIETVFFYGAGCSSEDKNNIIKEALSQFFRSSKIVVRHDIDAACYAMYNGDPNITCILGTGSNSCYYDGKNIIEHAPSLGFLIALQVDLFGAGFLPLPCGIRFNLFITFGIRRASTAPFERRTYGL